MKKTVEITEEELKLLNQIRDQKARQEAAARAEAERLANKAKLEAKFREAVNAGHKEIKQHLQAAKRELDLAVQTSEKYGVPFNSSIQEMESRRYIPHSFGSKWSDEDRSTVKDVLMEFDIYLGGREVGWEYWNTSSLNC